MPLLHSEYSLDFDGSDDVVSIGAVSELNFERTSPFSASYWFKTTSASNQSALGNLEPSPGFRGWESLHLSTGVIRFQLISQNPTNVASVNTDEAFSDGEWHHFVATYGGGSTAASITVYIDGEVVATTVFEDTLSGTTLSTAAFLIGDRSSGTTSFTGRIDEVAVYNKELSSTEVQTIYNAGLPLDLTTNGPTVNLAGYWYMGDGDTFPTITDQSASGNDGTMTNMAADDIVVDAPRPRESYYSFLFDGVDEDIVVGNHAEHNFDRLDPHSLSIWFKSASASGSMMVKKTPAGPGYQFHYSSTGTIQYRLINTNLTDEIDVLTTGVVNAADGNWHHAVVTYDGSGTAAGMALYLDGQEDTSINIDNLTGATTNATNLVIGSRDSTDAYFKGALCESSIWNKELTLAEVQDLYNSGRPKDARTIHTSSNLVGYWPLDDENSFPTVTDLSVSSNNGTATNMEASDINLDAPGVDFTTTELGNTVTIFNGTDEWVDMGDVLDFETTDPFSLCIFCRIEPGAQSVLIAKEEGSGAFEGYFTNVTASGDFFFRLEGSVVSNNKIEVASNVGSFADSNWRLFVATYDGSETAAGVTLYVDGVSVPYAVAADALTNSSLNTAPFQIGNRDSNNTPLNGAVDWAAVYSKVLTEAEVRTLFNERRASDLLETMPLANLEGYWRMGEGDTAPTITDHSGNGFDGTMTNMDASNFVPESPARLTSTYCIDFDGVDDEVDVGDVADLNFDRTDPFTLMCWVKGPSFNTLNTLLSKMGNSGDQRGYALFVRDTGVVNVILRRDAIEYVEVDSVGAPNVATGGWHHVAMTYDGSSLAAGVRLFVDGTEASSYSVLSDTLTTLPITNTAPFNIGIRHGALQPCAGRIDEAAVYNRVLSPSEISVLSDPQDHGAVGPLDNLVSWWRMGDDGGVAEFPTIEDYAPAYDNPGTMTNMVSGDIVIDSPLLLSHETLSYGAYTLGVMGPGIRPVGVMAPTLTYGGNQALASGQGTISYKMRGLADPGPGYVTWAVQSVPDFGAGQAPAAVQLNTAVVAGSWGSIEVIQQNPTPNLETIQNVSAASTVTGPGGGVTFVNVDTAQDTWNDLDPITLPASPSTGTEVIVKESGYGTRLVGVSGDMTTDGLPTGPWFTPDGSRVFQTCASADNIEVRDIAVPWDVSSTLSFVTSFSVSAQDINPKSVALNEAGTRMLVLGGNTDSIYQYNLTTPFDLTAGVSLESTRVIPTGTGSIAPIDFAVSPDGTRIFMLNGVTTNRRVIQFNLGTGWELSTFSDPGKNFDFQSLLGVSLAEGVGVNGSGTQIYVADTQTEKTYGVLLPTTAFELDDVEVGPVYDTPLVDGGNIRGIFVRKDVTQIITVQDSTDEVYAVYQEAVPKRITVDGNGNTIDGQATRIMSNPKEALHMVFNGNSWSIV